jgi:RecB family exonuclease
MLRAEGERAERVLWHLLAWELGREPFRIEHLEWAQIWTIEEATLRLRLDRVDRLDDGSLAVIDYKSGAPRAFDAMLERPEQPQLLAYALTAGEATAVVLAAYLGRDGLKLRGIADRADRLPGLRQAAEAPAMGPALLQSWQAQLQRLAHEFLAGYAAVDPMNGACEHCHLQALCRVDPALLRQS